jgi:hypothetical protein
LCKAIIACKVYLDDDAHLFINDITGKGSSCYFCLEERFKRLRMQRDGRKNREPEVWLPIK